MEEFLEGLLKTRSLCRFSMAVRLLSSRPKKRFTATLVVSVLRLTVAYTTFCILLY